MEIRRLPPTAAAAERYARELWLPYHRDLAAAASDHALADRPDDELIAAETEFRLDLCRENDDHRTWVVGVDPEAEAGDVDSEVLDPESPAPVGVPGPDRDLVAFVSTSVDACPEVFDRPDRLVVGDVYVNESYRGTGLADLLMERAVADARDHGCGELRLDVDVDNERATSFYERWGFEPYRRQLTVPVSEV
ncbi:MULTISPECIES: GNAT family N-acetyltransferase [Halorubrum]|uniref:Acetyltransferase (GNAT) family protein n=1 Tax=Halorubrum sodomense TaxID=35743 RepID=A0A1I6G7G6_HALSD|nr:MULTISPECIES: GNAT family N-acetyltransferase [Halorubrum]TKX53056.1 GNAT family N-acetyltransferase [Halorubrum sp. SP3]TKX69447.1 GNAT family N-acetyltransferase [Halorubrum sp. SP9]SFR38132.1 Acetyltransferase (GNAT) family protein [Halorubrum sodomense]